MWMCSWFCVRPTAELMARLSVSRGIGLNSLQATRLRSSQAAAK
jgi:hypothetical protein